MVYTSVMQYVESKSDLKEQIATLKKLIDEHYKAMIENAPNSVIERNAWDDGQIRIDTVYRSTASIMNAIKIMRSEYNLKKQELNRQEQGSIIELRDQSSFYR